MKTKSDLLSLGAILSRDADITRLLLDGIDVGVYLKGPDRRYLYINRAGAQTLYRAPDNVIGRTDLEMMAPEVERNIRRLDNLVFETGQTQHAEETLVGEDGATRYFWSTKKLIKGQDGQDCLLGYSAEVTALRNATEAAQQATEALRESEAKFCQAFASANTGMCIVNLQGKLVEVNEKMTEIFGYSKSELESMSVNDLAVQEDTQLSPRFIDHAVKGEVRASVFEKRYRHKDGHVIYGVVSSSLVHDTQGAPLFFISQVTDDTRRKHAEDALATANRELARLASTDPLTQIWNRRQFDSIVAMRTAQSLKSGESLCLLMMDIDHFKTINDTLGHRAGDQVLIELVEVVRGDLRAGDDFARWGGEEFLIILPNSSIKDALLLAEHLRMRVEEHTFERAGKVTVSVGVSEWKSGEAIDSWYNRVDRAMYCAKAAGRNNVQTGD